MAAFEPNSGDDVISAINITPFVDIVLVLLIIFMVTSTAIVKASLQVDLPKAASGESQVDTTINIVLTKEQELFFNGAPVSENELIDSIKLAAQGDSKAQAVIAADTAVEYGKVIHLIDLVKQNGIAKFALNIERQASPK